MGIKIKGGIKTERELQGIDGSCRSKNIFAYISIVVLSNPPDKFYNKHVGPSEVCALPLGIAAERSVHYFWDYFSSPFFLTGSHTFLPEGVVLGF